MTATPSLSVTASVRRIETALTEALRRYPCIELGVDEHSREPVAHVYDFDTPSPHGGHARGTFSIARLAVLLERELS